MSSKCEADDQTYEEVELSLPYIVNSTLPRPPRPSRPLNIDNIDGDQHATLRKFVPIQNAEKKGSSLPVDAQPDHVIHKPVAVRLLPSANSGPFTSLVNTANSKPIARRLKMKID